MSNCGCTPTPNPCGQPTCQETSCACPVYISSDCVNDVKAEFTCLPIESHLPLTQTLEAMDSAICDKFDEFDSHFDLINTGTGSEVYKGVNLLGQKQIRKINAVGDLTTVTQNTDDISVSINEEALNTFIEANQKLTVVDNAGTIGETLVKTAVVSGDTTTYPIKRLIHSDQDGEGESFVRDLQVNTDDLTLRTKKLKSDTLSIVATNEAIEINLPSTSTIPALYVNNLYEPTYEEWLAENRAQNSGVAVPGFEFIGKGTLAKTFTDTRVFTLNSPSTPPTITPNTAIQNALDTYVGDGVTSSAINPDLEGQKIIVQDNNSSYTFSGNFNYTGLNIELQADVISTTTGYVLDLDNATTFDQTNSTVTIFISKNKRLQIQGNGFNNSGNDETTTNYATGKAVQLLGEGLIYSSTNNITKYLINADITNSGNNNDGGLCFNIECKLRADYQGIYLVGGNGRIDIYNECGSGLLTGDVNLNLKAFHQTGGQVRLFKGADISFFGANTASRKSAFTFTPATGFTPFYISQNARYIGSATTLFDKLNNNNMSLEVTNSISYYGLDITNVFDSTNLWSVRFTENTLGSGTIDITKADLTKSNTVSSINTIGKPFTKPIKSGRRVSISPVKLI